MKRLYSFWVKTVKRAVALIPGLLLLFFALKRSLPLWGLTEQGEATVLRWEMEEGFWGRQRLAAVYQFENQGHKYSGRTVYLDMTFLNEYAAQKWAMQAGPKQSVSFDPANPERSTLEYEIPAGLYIRSLIALVIGLYFLLANRYNISNENFKFSRLFRAEL